MNPVIATFGFIVTLLFVSTVIVPILKRKNPEKDYSELSARVKTWWMMITVFGLAMLLSRSVSILFFAFVSFMALKEYFSIIPSRQADRRVLFWAYLAIPIQYLWVYQQWYGMFIIFIPVYMFLFLPFRMVLIGETEGFLRAASTIHWGLVTTVFCISHIGFLLVLPQLPDHVTSGAGLVLFLATLTQLNDVAQYVWGKSFGKNKIIPKVSPNKTWEGFLGGVATTSVVGSVLGPMLTPLSFPQSIVAGVLISSAGFIGDVTISALKRDLHIKDSGTLLPGHGGILDRIDSLTYTSPLFFHFIYYLHY